MGQATKKIVPSPSQLRHEWRHIDGSHRFKAVVGSIGLRLCKMKRPADRKCYEVEQFGECDVFLSSNVPMCGFVAPRCS